MASTTTSTSSNSTRATCVLLRFPFTNNVLVVNNHNPSDAMYSKSLIPFSFWGFPFIKHDNTKTPQFDEILQHNHITIEPSKEREFTLVERTSTPNFIDSVFDVSFYACTLDPSDHLVYLPSHNDFSYHLLPAPQLLRDFQDCKLHLPTEVLRVLRHVTTGAPHPDLDLETSARFHCFPILSNTIPPFKTTNLIVLVSYKEEGDVEEKGKGRGGYALLVDPGANTAGMPEFVAVLRKLKAMGVGEVQVFITHHHKDHWEGLPFLVDSVVFEAHEITILGHPSSLQRFDTGIAKKEVVGGDTILVGDLSVQVISTPGHTDDSLSLFHPPTRTLIAGDHVVGMGSAVLDLQCGNMKQYFESTKQMIALNPRVVYPAHGPPSFAPVQLLETYLKHRQAREDAILLAYNSGNHTLDGLVKVVYKDVPESMWPFAKSNIALHLGKLKEDGKIVGAAL